MELIENEKKSRVLNFISDGSVKNSVNGKNQSSMPSVPGTILKTINTKEQNNSKPNRHHSKNENLAEDQAKSKFNWDLLNNKYVGNTDKKPGKSLSVQENSAATSRKNAHLEALQYKPSRKLSPVDEEDIQNNINAIDQAVQLQTQRKGKGLTKIDESLLSTAAKIQQSSKDHIKSPIIVSKGSGHWNVAPLKPLLEKQSSLPKNEKEE